MLSEEDKKDLLAMAHSPSLKHDFRKLASLQPNYLPYEKETVETFIRFNTEMAELFDHPQKPISNFQGKHWIL